MIDVNEINLEKFFEDNIKNRLEKLLVVERKRIVEFESKYPEIVRVNSYLRALLEQPSEEKLYKELARKYDEENAHALYNAHILVMLIRNKIENEK